MGRVRRYIWTRQWLFLGHGSRGFSLSSMGRAQIEKDDGGNFVDGRRVALSPSTSSGSKRTCFPVREPARGRVVHEWVCSSEEDVKGAVSSSLAAFPQWSSLSGMDRSSVLRRVADSIQSRKREIAELEVRYNGKPIYEAEIDVGGCADTFHYYASLAATLSGSYFSGVESSAFATRKPYGVCAGIGAWNYPFQTASWKIAPALACGNTFVYKPSPLSPFTPLVLADIVHQAGAPPGTLNIVQGEGETGRLLCVEEDVRKVSFTGSLSTGQKIMQTCATRGIKPVTMELGGKGALLIFPDADMDSAVEGAIMANFFSQGQVCSNASKVYVHVDVMSEFRAKLLERIKSLKVGDPYDPDTRIGATISKDHAEKVLAYIQSARDEGGRVLCGGERVEVEGCEGGDFLSPCVLEGLGEEARVAKEEIFGAVLLLMEFQTEEDVLARANRTQFKLAAGVFTNDIRRGHRVAERLDFGTVWVNSYNITPVDVPFGGNKWSGFGRENGVAALESYTQFKSVYMDFKETADPVS